MRSDTPVDPDEQARARVERLLNQMSGRDLPVLIGERLEPEAELQPLREEAEDLADAAGRGGLVEDARDRIARGYVAQFGFHARRVSWGGSGGMATPRERADSQMALGDLVLAVAMEDLLTASVVGPLAADGERLLGTTATHADELPAADSLDLPRTDPFARLDGLRQQGWAIAAGVGLVALAVVTALGVTEDIALAGLVGMIVAVMLLISVSTLWGRESESSWRDVVGEAMPRLASAAFWIVAVLAIIVGLALEFDLVAADRVDGLGWYVIGVAVLGTVAIVARRSLPWFGYVLLTVALLYWMAIWLDPKIWL